MPISYEAQNRLHDFYAVIEPWEKGYEKSSFSYVAVRNGDDFDVVQAALWLNTIESKVPFKGYETKSIRAGQFRLSDLKIGHRQFIDRMLTGRFDTPHGELTFPPIRDQHSLLYTSVHPLSAQQSQSRVNVVRLGGREQSVQHRQSVLDWELRGASVPYDSFSELMGEYGLGGLYQDVVSIEIIAMGVLGFDNKSAVEGTTATVIVRFAKMLPSSNVSVGYRVFSHGKVVERSSLHKDEIEWTADDDMQIGRATITVPPAAVIHCYGNYLGVTQTHWWITDPTTAQNSRRTVYETFDSDLVVMKDFLSKAQARGRNARDLEAAVSWLFWMLGFSIAQLGGTAKTQDAADLILVSPSGQYAVVECTTGLLRSENKMPLLIARTEAVRRRLIAANQAHLKVLPVMVTSRTKDEVRADIEQAEKLGVLVLTQEPLEEALTRTLIAPNADELFSQAEKTIQAGLAKYDTKSAPEQKLELS